RLAEQRLRPREPAAHHRAVAENHAVERGERTGDANCAVLIAFGAKSRVRALPMFARGDEVELQIRGPGEAVLDLRIAVRLRRRPRRAARARRPRPRPAAPRVRRRSAHRGPAPAAPCRKPYAREPDHSRDKDVFASLYVPEAGFRSGL